MSEKVKESDIKMGCEVTLSKHATENDTVHSNNNEKQSILTKLRSFRDNITVEPLLACYVMPSVLAALAVQNLNLEKACRVNRGYGEEVCNNIINQNVENYTEEVQNVQILVANMAAWKSPLQTSIPALLILFIGGWSDRTGLRRPCMLLPFVGEFLTSLGLLMCAFYWLEWPLEIAGIVEALPPALTGGWTTMFMSVFSYISDNTTLENRTFRMGVVNIFASLGVPIGTALSGVLTKKLGFYGVFTISICIYIVGFNYGFFFLKDKKKIQESKEHKNVCNNFFDPKHVSDTLMVALRSREGTRRLRVILLMIIFIFLTGPVYGEIGVLYLFARYKFNFTEVEFSIFTTYAVCMNLFGTIIAITVFSKYFKMEDSMMGVLAGISKITASFFYAFAPNTTWFYIGEFFNCLSGTGLIAMRSLATKLVEPSETGRVHSLFGVCEAVVPIIYSPLYSQVYVRTLHTMPGTIFLMGAFLTVPAVVIFGFMYFLQKQEDKLNISHGNDITLKEKRPTDEKEKYAYTNEVTTM